jgi:prevent-host-death family protein
MQVTIHAAKTQLSRLIEAVLAGEEVIIARGSRPVARLVPVAQNRFRFGLLKDRLTDPAPDLLEPMEEGDLSLWEGRD